MRIEMKATGLMGMMNVAFYQMQFNSFSNLSDEVKENFERVSNSLYSLNGGVGTLQNAATLIQQRITQENQKRDNIQSARNETNNFLKETVATDRRVENVVSQNNEQFYQINPYLKPSAFSTNGLSRDMLNSLMMVYRVNESIQTIFKKLAIISFFRKISRENDPKFRLLGQIDITLCNQDKCGQQYKQDKLRWLLLLFGGMGVMETIKPIFSDKQDDIIKEKSRSTLAKFLNNELKVEGSVVSGEITGKGKFLGASTSGSASGSILYGEAGIESKISLDFKDKNFGISTEAKASGALAKGEVQGNWGYLHGKAEGEAITGAVSGEVKATLWDDGKFNPSLYAGGKAEASVLQGNAEIGFGTDQYGVYGKADGSVLHAEAEAQAGIGYVGKDKKGNAQYGVVASAEAMACLAQGKVQGGITVFGIDIDIGAKGYAGAAGVEAGASITTKGVKGKFGGALGLGGELEISMDWSDAKWVGDTVDTVA